MDADRFDSLVRSRATLLPRRGFLAAVGGFVAGALTGFRASADSTNDPTAAIEYARKHWNWPAYNRATPPTDPNHRQDDFQCAEFVARSLAAAGPIADLTHDDSSDRYATIAWQDKTYNLRLAADLYRFLTETSIGQDVGTAKKSAALGAAVFYGDLEHVALVTSVAGSNVAVTAHNTALLDYPIDKFQYEDGSELPVTHVVVIDYRKLSAGELSSANIPGAGPVTMIAPAPFNGGIVTSSLTLKWKPVPDALGYEVAVYRISGQLLNGVSTLGTSFFVDLDFMDHGVYNYSIEPRGVADFLTYYDSFNFEDERCRKTPSAISCGGGSGIAAHLAPRIVEGPTVDEIGQSEATIDWWTDQRADGAVDYGLTTDFDQSVVSDHLLYHHRLVLSGLEPSTTYQYEARSTNINGTIGSTRDLSFTTEAAIVSTQPQVCETDPPCGDRCEGRVTVEAECVCIAFQSAMECSGSQCTASTDCGPNSVCVIAGCDDSFGRCRQTCVQDDAPTDECPGVVCDDGSCCFGQAKCCNGTCVGLLTDPANCSDCNIVCESGVCDGGVCADASTGACANWHEQCSDAFPCCETMGCFSGYCISCQDDGGGCSADGECCSRTCVDWGDGNPVCASDTCASDADCADGRICCTYPNGISGCDYACGPI